MAKRETTKNREDRLKKEKLNLIVFLVLFVIASILFFKVLQIFLIPILLAITFSILFFPLYKRLLKLFRDKKNLTSILFCFFIIIVILVPLYIIGDLVVKQGLDFVDTANTWIKNDMAMGTEGVIGQAKNWINIVNIDIQGILSEGIKSGGKLLTAIVNQVSSGFLGVLAKLFLTFYTMFYFFRDGDKIIKKIRYYSPLRDEYEDELMQKFSSISNATIKGTVVVGIIQGIVGTITLVIFGIKGWVLWGVVMMILSIIPIVGNYVVMVPIAIFKIAAGHIWQGIIIIFVSIVLNWAIDYFIRPRLVGHESKMHDLLIFFSTLGGIAVFGVMGFIIGPIIAMIFMTLLDIYAKEFKDILH